MSDFVPLEIQAEILKRLPVKSLIQFRSVSKSFKSLIDSTQFVKSFHVTTSQQPNHRLLVSYIDSVECSDNYVSIVDDDTFPENKSVLTVPEIVNNEPLILGSSQGLFCFYLTPGVQPELSYYSALIWNPTIQKHVDVDVPDVLGSPYETFIGFGVCPDTLDPKIVRISYVDQSWCDDDIPGCVPWQVSVFTLSSRVWKGPFNYLARKSIALTKSQIVIDRFIYWLVNDRIRDNGQLILSFDMTAEKFTEIELPHSQIDPEDEFEISKLKESLVVLEPIIMTDHNNYYLYQTCAVWVIEPDVPNKFVKLYIIYTPDAELHCESVLGFRKTAEPIISMMQENDDGDHVDSIAVYNPDSEQLSNIGLSGEVFTFFVSSYMETLLLLDQQILDF